MMTVFNRFGAAEPMFGRARLPNDLEMTNKEYGWCYQIVRVGQIARRAVGTNVRQLFCPSPLAQLATLNVQTWYTMGQRLGAFMGFDHMLERHPSTTSRKPGNRSGASPYQSTLMTKIKIFVPYFKSPIVSL